MREEINSGFGHQRVTGCSVKFTRRFIEIDQEITSTITDIEGEIGLQQAAILLNPVLSVVMSIKPYLSHSSNQENKSLLESLS